MSCSKLDIEVLQGKTFVQVVRWETTPIVYKAITAISNTAPVQLTVAGHGAPHGWRALVESAGGMTEINSEHNPPWATDYHQLTYVDANTVQFNDINASGFGAYTSGGYLRYNTPQSLVGYTARMKIKDRLGGTVLHTLTTENGGIALDTSAYTITLTISATDTAAFTFRTGVYDLELVSSGGAVTQILYGKVSLTQEVTT